MAYNLNYKMRILKQKSKADDSDYQLFTKKPRSFKQNIGFNPNKFIILACIIAILTPFHQQEFSLTQAIELKSFENDNQKEQVIETSIN